MATFKLSKDHQGKFRWSLRSDNNGNIIAVASESYDSSAGAKESIAWMRANAKDAAFEDLT